MRLRTQFHANLKISLNKFYINILIILQQIFIHKTIVQYLSTADIHIFILPFVHCAFCLPWQRRYGNIYNGCRQMQRRRHHMTARSSALLLCQEVNCQEHQTSWSSCAIFHEQMARSLQIWWQCLQEYTANLIWLMLCRCHWNIGHKRTTPLNLTLSCVAASVSFQLYSSCTRFFPKCCSSAALYLYGPVAPM